MFMYYYYDDDTIITSMVMMTTTTTTTTMTMMTMMMKLLLSTYLSCSPLMTCLSKSSGARASNATAHCMMTAVDRSFRRMGRRER